MEEYEVEIVTELDEVEVVRVVANLPYEAQLVATAMVEQGRTHLYGRIVINASVL